MAFNSHSGEDCLLQEGNVHCSSPGQKKVYILLVYEWYVSGSSSILSFCASDSIAQ